MWNPLNVSGCHLWLDSSQITNLTSGQQVSQWNDLSGYNNHALSVGTNKPLYYSNVLSGKGGVHFTSNQYLKSMCSLPSQYTIFMMIKVDSGAPAWDTPLEGSPMADQIIYGNSNYFTFYSRFSTSTFTATNFHILQYSRNSSTGIIRVNKNIYATGSANSALSDYIWIGSDTGTEYHNGYINEIIIYHKILSDTERTQVEDYLNWKWLGATRPAFMYNKIVVKNNDYIMQYNNNTWINTNNSSDIDLNVFNTYGIDDVSIISSTKWKELNKFKIYTYIDDTSVNLDTKLTAIPQAQLIKMSTGIDLKSVDKINSFTITSNIANQGINRVLISFDNGSTWKYIVGTTWSAINDINDLVEVKNNAMTKETFNSISSASWETERGNSSNIRFAFYLEINSLSDVANEDRIDLNCNLKGKWQLCYNNGTIYDVFYENEKITTKIYQSGTYKINYPI